MNFTKYLECMHLKEIQAATTMAEYIKTKSITTKSERSNQAIDQYNNLLYRVGILGNNLTFIFWSKVWDLIKLADYLTQREDIDPNKIGITGMSMGGYHSWFAGFADTRYATVVPIVGTQGVGWTLENEKWKAGAEFDPMRSFYKEAQKDLGKSTVDKELVEKVLDRIAPGLTSNFDSPYTIPAIAPRPLLIIIGSEDPYTPVESLEIPVSKAQKAYKEANSEDKFKFIAEPGIPHEFTPLMVKEASDWFDKFLKN